MVDTGISAENKRKIIGIIKAIIPDAKIYLFGSRATGKQRTGSDIDIALDADHKLSMFELGEVKDVLNATSIIHKIDVVDVNRIPKEMLESIKKESISWND